MFKLARRLAHYAVYLAAAVLILVSLVALALRFLVMPDINRYREQAEAIASQAVGMPVRVGALEADWWGLNPRFRLLDLELAPPGQGQPLRLARVDATLSWLSLFIGEARLANLDLWRPSLEIHRDRTGVIRVAGIPVNLPGGPSPFPDWLLDQRGIVVSDGRLTWRDDLLGAPPLVVDRVNLVSRNLLGHHRFGVTGRPGGGAALKIDLRGNLKGDSVHVLEGWSGQLYARVDGASAEAMRRWVPWSQDVVRNGVGDLRFWLDVDQGQARGVTGDVRLANVAVSLAGDLPDMRFRHISGHLGWSRDKNGHLLFVEGLRFATQTGEGSEPARAKVRLTPGKDGGLARAQVEASDLRLEALTALSSAIPLPRTIHDWVARVNPRGEVENIEFTWEGRDRFRLATWFRGVGLNAADALPGFSGLSGHVVTDQDNGEATLTSDGLRLDMDRVFRQPLSLSRLDAKLTWVAEPKGGHRIQFGPVRLANADLEGVSDGSILLRPGQAPVLDIRGHLNRGEGNAVWRYLPRQVADDAYEWVKRSIVGGISPDTRLVLKGPLDRFPFDQGGGEFRVDVRLRDASLNYAPGWPGITGINGMLSFHDKRMLIDTEGGRILGTTLGRVKAEIPDLHYSPEEMLTLDGQAGGPTSAFLEFIRQSPVFDYTERFTEPMRASGNGRLTLNLRLPLRQIRNSQVSGSFQMTDNHLWPGEDMPELAGLNGTLAFTDDWVRGENLTTRVYQQPVTFNLASERGGRLKLTGQGQLNAASLGQWLPPSLARRVGGATTYQMDVGLQQRKTSLRITSTLAGLSLDLPAPLGKRADQSQSLVVTLPEVGGKAPATLDIQYGKQLSARYQSGPAGPRATLALGGGDPRLPGEPGLALRGRVASLDLDAWRAIAREGGQNGSGLPLREVQLTGDQMIFAGRRFHGLTVLAQPVGRLWNIRLAGKEAQGEIQYEPARGDAGDRLQARLARLALPEADPSGSGPAPAAGELPRHMEFDIRDLSYAGHALGAFQAHLESDRGGYRASRLSLEAPAASLSANGWLSGNPRQASDLRLAVESRNLGEALEFLGYPHSVKGGVFKASGNLGWPGGIDNFAIGQLNGRLRMELRNGRFLKLDPGAGRLLGILSLQTLPRRIALDFRDVFSEGYAFDEIEGDAHIDRGVAYLPGLRIDGPSAEIRMNGKVNLGRETQDLRLAVQPRLDEGAVLAGALLGGPVVGVGALVASKVLQNPIGKATRFEYLVTGTWDEPVVTRLARPAPPPDTSP